MSDLDALLKAVAANRKAHRLTLEDAQRGYSLPEAERRAGIPRHLVNGGSIALRFAYAALRAATDAMPQTADRNRAHGLCAFAVLDGYALARAAAPNAKKNGAAFSHKNVASRFVESAGTSGQALLAGPLEEAARAIVAHWAAQAPKGHEETTRTALAHALAGGVALFAKERGLDAGDLAGLGRPPPKERRSAKGANHATVPKALMAKILANPADDAPRLVLADWLTEQGDPRGEFIQLQCALGRGTFGAGAKHVERRGAKLPFEQRKRLEETEKALLKLHEKRWLAPVRKYLREWGFRRGFLEKVICEAGAWFDGLEALSGEPIEKAHLVSYKRASLKKIHAAQPHPSVWLIELSRTGLEATDLELVGSRAFSTLQALDLWGNGFGDAGAMALAPLLPPPLRRLGLSSNLLRDAGVAALAKSAVWPRLTHLSLGFNDDLGDGAVEALASARSLQWLELSGTSIGASGAARLAKLPLPALANLSIRNHALDAAGARALIESKSLTGLKVLELHRDTDPKVRAAALARFGPAPELQDPVFFR